MILIVGLLASMLRSQVVLCSVLDFARLDDTVLCYAMLCYAKLHNSIHKTTPYNAIQHMFNKWNTILITLYYAVMNYTMPYYAIMYYEPSLLLLRFFWKDLERALAEAEREMNLQRAGEIKSPGRRVCRGLVLEFLNPGSFVGFAEIRLLPHNKLCLSQGMVSWQRQKRSLRTEWASPRLRSLGLLVHLLS